MVKFPHFFFQAFFIDCTDLFEQNDGIFCKATMMGIQFNMGRQLCLVPLTGDCSRNYSRTIFISNIILYD